MNLEKRDGMIMGVFVGLRGGLCAPKAQSIEQAQCVCMQIYRTIFAFIVAQAFPNLLNYPSSFCCSNVSGVCSGGSPECARARGAAMFSTSSFQGKVLLDIRCFSKSPDFRNETQAVPGTSLSLIRGCASIAA